MCTLIGLSPVLSKPTGRLMMCDYSYPVRTQFATNFSRPSFLSLCSHSCYSTSLACKLFSRSSPNFDASCLQHHCHLSLWAGGPFARPRVLPLSSLSRFFSSRRELSELHCSSPDACQDTPLENVGSVIKQNIVDDELVDSRDNGDGASVDGLDNRESLSSPEYVSKVDEEEHGVHVPLPVVDSASILGTLILICPFFLWGTAMVAMKGLLPKAGPMFVASVRLIPAGLLLIGYGACTGKKQPTGVMAWVSIGLFGLIDASCFQGFLAEGLKRTTAGLGSVIIDSQPLTVAILAALIFGESLGLINYTGLVLGIVGLFLLEAPVDALQSLFSSAGDPSGGTLLSNVSWLSGLVSWERGEWRMLLAAQSMAVGTVMIRWVCRFSDPFMATGWHMVLGGIPLLALSVLQQDPAVHGHIQDLNVADWSALLYTSVAGSAISYGVFFYNATKGSLTKLSSLTFLTPMFAALFGFLFLNETLTSVQLLGGIVTLGGVLLVNYKPMQSRS